MRFIHRVSSVRGNVSAVQRTALSSLQAVYYKLANGDSYQGTSFPGVLSRGYATAANHYDTLGVSPKATQAQVKAAYYRLSKQYHPDISKDGGAKEKFALISQAYEVLGNIKNRRQYDRGLLYGGHGHSSDIDIEFESKIKNRSKFGKRPDSPHTGRSHIYNFDEYYKEHYGESIRMNHKAQEASSRMQAERKQRYQQDMTKAWTLGATLFGVVLWLYKKHR